MNKSLFSMEAVRHTYVQGDQAVDVLKDITFSLKPGEVVGLMGPSGAGKSTLLHLAGLLEPPTQGNILIQGVACKKLSDGERTRLRRETLGFVYQFHHLLPEFNAEENIILPQLMAGASFKQAKARARDLLEQVGVLHRATHRPAQLSGGEQQRVAIARALANNPCLLLADEPTGNLDEKTGDYVFEVLAALAKKAQFTALIATHNLTLARRMDRILSLHEGKLCEGINF
ncbi:MAG: ABC transporter ATP-binding protein [Alphaproteobacteria bacterium]